MIYEKSRKKLEKFANESVQLLEKSPSLELNFARFPIEYKALFNKSLIIADFGFVKLSELLYAVEKDFPNKFKIFDEDKQSMIIRLVESRNRSRDRSRSRHTRSRSRSRERNSRRRSTSGHSELKFQKKIHFRRTKTLFFYIFKSTKIHFLTFSKVQKHIFCYFKNGKKSIFAPVKSLKLPKILKKP